MSGKPLLLSLECSGTQSERPKSRTVDWRQIGPPVTIRFWFNVTGPFDGQRARVADGVQRAQVCLHADVAVAERVSPAIVTLEVTAPTGDAIGSGVIYSADGWIVTNKHVVADETSIVVHLKDGRDFAGSVYGIDTLTDQVRNSTGTSAMRRPNCAS